MTGSNIGWSRHASDPLLAVQICAITAFLPPSDQLRYRCASDYPRRPDPVGERWRSVPAALWPGIWLSSLLPRLGSSSLVLHCRSRWVWWGRESPCRGLQRPWLCVTTAASVSRVWQAMHRDIRWPTPAALTGLAELLDGGTVPSMTPNGVPSRSPASFLRKSGGKVVQTRPFRWAGRSGFASCGAGCSSG